MDKYKWCFKDIFIYAVSNLHTACERLLLKLKAHCLIKITSLVIFHPRLQFKI